MGKVLALAGNPNVGKSTVFNALTGLKQHTGNWPGKTVSNARGTCDYNGRQYELVDLPGCYSLMAHSEEEEIARDYICFAHPDVVIAVCDATCLERNLNLVLQIIEAAEQVIVCVNLMDEAAKKQIHIDIKGLSKELGVPVIGITAREEIGLERIFLTLQQMEKQKSHKLLAFVYEGPVERAIGMLEPAVEWATKGEENTRWFCARLLDANSNLLDSMEEYLGYSLVEDAEVAGALKEAVEYLAQAGYSKEKISDAIAASYIRRAEQISRKTVQYRKKDYDRKDRRLDWIFTSKKTGFPIMFLMLLLVFWITICGANYPSQLLSDGLFWGEDKLVLAVRAAGVPKMIYEPLIYGVYRVAAWVVSVMLPPMAIFFPLFTLLEDLGYLPRVAFNLDHCFQRCHACGKQALTMCMGFGCNAVGVTGCRIIDSPRERLIAIITNNFVPCNGRFPMLLSIISMFLIGNAAGIFSSFLSALLLAGVIVLGILMTLLVSRILSGTILKGLPSSFTLELPPYRRPQIGKVIVRSVLDRTVFVLGRAIAVAAPAGLVIWLMANFKVGDATVLARCADFLDPFARLMGLDGIILLAFILGMPANEIVMPIVVMCYLAQGSLLELGDSQAMWTLLSQNGWTWVTAISTMLFSLMHWPCATTCLTIRKETGSLKWMLLSILVPTVAGIAACMAFTFIAGLVMA
ncbi:ferrous iron transport protein B [[Clostridium] scindens]|uniref:ferrous iron transport protein B n=1 Tax=Clostridium scindens (strain JCM 10418 / VPI 12708) TaxID=29347 RepID=UPI00156D44D0|nr:ferrous iron transport protein B [[Clostridium] scindens]NSI89698.1 ferrous iron transport protein B [[Clostridium] scindens]NSJ04419.1 ferrous iron transport protein B [[Clostridium] scindens]